MINKKITKQVLIVGPDYRNHRGGIGAVIGIHKDYYEQFNFIPTYKPYRNNLLKSLYFLRQFAFIIYQLLKRAEIKVLHIHSSKQGSFYRKLLIAITAKFIFRKRIIYHIHTGNFKRFYDNSNAMCKRIIASSLRLNDLTLTVSDSWKHYFESIFHLKNVYKLNNLVVAPSLTNRPAYIGPDRCINFLFLGLIEHNKGIFDLLQVLQNNKEALTGKCKLFIGGNGKIDLLNDTIREAGLADLVEYKGWVSGDEKGKLLQYTDVFILPSYFEGVPMAILEAMSYGKPVIATTAGGIPEIVKDFSNGLLISPGDHKALLNALLYYINSPENIQHQGKKSLEFIKEHYPDIIMPRLEGFYASLL